MVDDSEQDVQVRSALRFLYGAAAAWLRRDADAVSLAATAALDESDLGTLLYTGVMSVAEQLRDRPSIPVVDPLGSCAGYGDPVQTLLLEAADRYLQQRWPLWDLDGLCTFALDPARTVHTIAQLLGMLLSGRATDTGADALQLAEHVCLGLASRSAAAA